MLFRAVKAGAVHMDNATALDEGAGYVNVPNAWEILKKWIEKKEYEKFQAYNVTAYSPDMPEERAQNLYIRNGLTLNSNDAFTFFVSRTKADLSEKFNRIYKIKSDSPWLSPVQNKVYIRNQQPASVTVRLDRSKMTEPGLYCSTIKAIRQNDNFPEFEMTAAIVIPYEFNSANNYSFNSSEADLKPGNWKRYYLSIPAGTGVLTVKLAPSKDAYADVLFRLFDNDGQKAGTSPSLTTAIDREEVCQNYYNLKPGVYEIVVNANYQAKDISAFSIHAEINGLAYTLHPQQGKEKKVEISNSFGRSVKSKVSGKLLGYFKEKTILIQNSLYSYNCTIKKNEIFKKFSISVSKEDFNKMTDFSLVVYDQSQSGTVKPVIAKTGMESQEGYLQVFNPDDSKDSVVLCLKIVPAFAKESVDIFANLKEETVVKELTSLTFVSPADSKVNIYPGCTKTVSFRADKTPFEIPSGCLPFGEIFLKSDPDGKAEYEIPFNLD
jgi:hypothetical protein